MAAITHTPKDITPEEFREVLNTPEVRARLELHMRCKILKERLETDEEMYRLIEIKNGMVCGIKPMMYTWAIMCDVGEDSYGYRYCYPSLLDCIVAYQIWDGVGDPVGYIVRKGLGEDKHGPGSRHFRG